MVTATGLVKLANQSWNVAPPGEYDCMVMQVPIRQMILISPPNFTEIWSAISTLWLVHFCRTTEKWPTPCVYGGHHSPLLFKLPPPNMMN